MTINTKFNIAQEVFFMNNNKIDSGRILNIYPTIEGKSSKNQSLTEYDMTIEYGVCIGSNLHASSFTEDLLFESKEDLLKSL